MADAVGLLSLMERAVSTATRLSFVPSNATVPIADLWASSTHAAIWLQRRIGPEAPVRVVDEPILWRVLGSERLRASDIGIVGTDAVAVGIDQAQPGIEAGSHRVVAGRPAEDEVDGGQPATR